MTRLFTGITLTLVLFLVSACGTIVGPTAQEMTLIAQNESLSTQLADLRTTATVEVDRMMITVEHAATEVRSVARQRDALRATLIARGTDASMIDLGLPDIGDLPEGIAPDQLLTNVTPGAAPPVTPAGIPNPGGIDPSLIEVAPQVTPTPATGPRLENPTLASGVNANDCAIDSLTTFPENASEIYLVATAIEFPANTTITANWSREGALIGSFDIPFNFAIDNACIWAFIDQTDFVFTPGTWTVSIDINGTPAIAPIIFSITSVDTTGQDGVAQPEG